MVFRYKTFRNDRERVRNLYLDKDRQADKKQVRGRAQITIYPSLNKAEISNGARADNTSRIYFTDYEISRSYDDLYNLTFYINGYKSGVFQAPIQYMLEIGGTVIQTERLRVDPLYYVNHSYHQDIISGAISVYEALNTMGRRDLAARYYRLLVDLNSAGELDLLPQEVQA
jgi:hypothetical protein